MNLQIIPLCLNYLALNFLIIVFMCSYINEYFYETQIIICQFKHYFKCINPVGGVIIWK